MSMLCGYCEHSQKWETHLYLEIRKELEEIVKACRTVLVGLSARDHFKVVEQNSNSGRLVLTTCSCRR